MTPGYLIPTPLGDIALRVEDDFLTGLYFVGQKYFPAVSLMRVERDAPRLVVVARQQIAEFFSGERHAFTLPIRLRGTPFQRRVWAELAAIPYASLTSYRAIALDLGFDADHARAVGSAVGRNPVSVIVPCHRVVATSGGLTGYAGGIDRKAALLALETRSLPIR
ncbi:MAG TPA: methylated-DNA--[protein]-cysteine S-methyltransferase [Paraburkholderia sp.]|jgi:methylated-DNA-[protein]-cysteine S-methyltransferase